MPDQRPDVTRILIETRGSAPPEIARRLFPVVYQELKALAHKYMKAEKHGDTLQPTALVHEAFVRMVDQRSVDWQGRSHFYAVCAQAMRRVLIDHARARRRDKRGGRFQRVALDESIASPEMTVVDAMALHDALEQLARLDAQQARIVELRFFSGMTVEEVAHVLGVSKRKVEADWTHAKAWLRAALATDPAQ